MSVPTASDFPSSYSDARGRIGVRPFGVVPGAVRHLELSVAGRSDAFPAVTGVSDEVGLVATVSLAEGSAWLTASTLAGWGVSAEQVVGDVLSSLGDVEVDVRPVGEGSFIVHGEVFAGAVWGRPQLVGGLPVTGTPVIWNGGEGVTLVTGDQDPEGFQIAVAVLTERLQSGAELETLTPHRLVDEAWTPSTWPTAVHDALRLTERLFARHWYERQREPLRERYERQGQEVNVPEYRVMEGPDGAISAAACVAGIPNLIPEVDTVLVINTDGSPQPYSFTEFRVKFAASLHDVGVSPVRWLTHAAT